MNLLFLCTGNSCRSQMAEGWARKLAPEWLRVQSAGIEAHGKNPRAIAVMAEAGVDISAQESTRITEDMLQEADLVKFADAVPTRARKEAEMDAALAYIRETAPRIESVQEQTHQEEAAK